LGIQLFVDLGRQVDVMPSVVQDAFVQIALSSQGDGVLSAQGTSTIGGITAPISRLDIDDGGLVSDVDSILDFEFRVPESPDSDLFVETRVVD